MDSVISAHVANRLFWLGRYAERGYLMLHLMRRAYDEVIDVPKGVDPYSDFLEKIGVFVSNKITSSYQMMELLYDADNVSSLCNIIERVMDNAIVLRPVIYSESFSYIEMCRDLLRSKASKQEMNITELQPITDWLLAFWGSIGERVYGQAHTLLEIGRLVEHIDMNVRFEYQHYRIDEAWLRLKKCMVEEPELFDRVQAGRVETFVADKNEYDKYVIKNKYDITAALNSLVKI